MPSETTVFPWGRGPWNERPSFIQHQVGGACVSMETGEPFPFPHHQTRPLYQAWFPPPFTQEFGETGKFDPGVWHGSRQNNKKRHKSRGKEVNTGGRCEGGELKYGYHHTSGANQSSLKEKECILIKVCAQPLAFAVQMPTCVMLPKDLRAVAFRALCRWFPPLSCISSRCHVFHLCSLAYFPPPSVSNHYLSERELQNVTADHRIEKGANGNSKWLWMWPLLWNMESGHPQRTRIRDAYL